MPVLVSAALGAAPPQRAGMASGAVNTFRQLGYALGIALLGTVFADALHGLGPGASREAVGAGYVTGLTHIMLISGVVALAAGLLVLAVVRRGSDDAGGAGRAGGGDRGAGADGGVEAASGRAGAPAGV
ncbi:MFS transporter, partial [Streptomyces lydicus]